MNQDHSNEPIENYLTPLELSGWNKIYFTLHDIPCLKDEVVSLSGIEVLEHFFGKPTKKCRAGSENRIFSIWKFGEYEIWAHKVNGISIMVPPYYTRTDHLIFVSFIISTLLAHKEAEAEQIIRRQFTRENFPF